MEYFNHEGWKGDIRSSRQIFEYTIENANVLFSYLLGKEAGTYNGIDGTEIFTLEIELFAPRV